MIKCDEIIFVMDIVSTKKTNTIATSVTSTASIIFYNKKVRDCYILQTGLIAIILLLIITIICMIMQKKAQYKMEHNETKKVCTKSPMCYYCDDIIKLVDFLYLYYSFQ